ncbi:MAG: glutathione S-transferase [Maricaulis sp.]|jgi:glutathione S-transferase|nr:glutathione S-transferase [Maricaulis sp.]HAQ34476.1 glutathione S-transferase family protein [Alphaproteobacteria bacterium]
MTASVTVYGDSRSGNCWKVRWVAERLSIPFEWKEVDVTSGYTRTAEFLSINPAGQVPCLVRQDGRTLAQSAAIMLYLAEGSDLIPPDPFDRAKMMEWLYWEQYSHEPAIAVRRYQKAFLNKRDDEIDPFLMNKGRRALGVMELRLVARDYFVTDAMTLADIALYAYTHVAGEGGFDLEDFPAVRAWLHRVEHELAAN